jgi:DNA invertase Pin-like site-specific DNA recombinase
MTASPQIEALAENPVWVPTGRAIAAIMATLAELELELGRERRAASRESRRARQPPVTKPPRLTADRREQLRRLGGHRRAGAGARRGVWDRVSYCLPVSSVAC